jgi:hypothetical protein
MGLQQLGGMVVLGLVALASLSRGAAPAPDKDRVDYSQVAAGGPGVSSVVRDEKGRILSVLVVGRSRISTVLGAGKGKEVALQQASLQADSEFVKWLDSKVEVHENAQNETTLFLEGSEENDTEALRESGMAVEKTTEQYTRTAQHLVRGMQLVHRELNAGKKELTIVKKWHARNAEAIASIVKKGLVQREDQNKRRPVEAARPARKQADKTLEDEKVTIKE